MENASKALIIAGAILLSILLISLGIMIFNQAQDTVNNGGMSQAEMQAFNNKFLKYEGTRTGSEVKALINEVLASNADTNNAKRQVYVKLIETGSTSSSESTKTPVTSEVNVANKYKITMNYAKSNNASGNDDSTIGCIYKILIENPNR